MIPFRSSWMYATWQLFELSRSRTDVVKCGKMNLRILLQIERKTDSNRAHGRCTSWNVNLVVWRLGDFRAAMISLSSIGVFAFLCLLPVFMELCSISIIWAGSMFHVVEAKSNWNTSNNLRMLSYRKDALTSAYARWPCLSKKWCNKSNASGQFLFSHSTPLNAKIALNTFCLPLLMIEFTISSSKTGISADSTSLHDPNISATSLVISFVKSESNENN